jgi:protein-tyrosine phosphatase
VKSRNENREWREVGLYLDPGWRPDWPAVLIDWPDFGLPSSPKEAVEEICNVFKLARNGTHVEVGCLGGMGRTGTVLACMAILAGVPVAEAVNWVRTNYSINAVEGPEQEQWVHSFAKQISSTE